MSRNRTAASRHERRQVRKAAKARQRRTQAVRRQAGRMPRPSRPGGYLVLKRLLDILLSGLAILALSPLLVPVMVVLKCTGEHDVFYGQDRIGFHNRHFKILKFATMLRNSPNMAGGLHTTHGDPRVLPFGRFLRKTKINELPQLFNILLGDMSIIGPRPLVEKTFAPYSDEVKARIYNVKPGLSGIGSVVFRDEETLLTDCQMKGMSLDEAYAKIVSPYKGALEMWYQDHLGLWTDFWLVFLTAWVIVFPKSDLMNKVFRDLPRRASAA